MHPYRVSFAAGLAIGFVAGTRAGRERYDQMVKIAKATKDSPAFQQATGVLQAQATGLLSTAGQKVADTVPQLAHKVEEHIPVLKHRNGNGHTAANGKSGASSKRPFTATTNSHLPSS
jgi:hypothetical protein